MNKITYIMIIAILLPACSDNSNELLNVNYYAAWDDEIIEKILYSGADINARNHEGRTALHFASQLGNLKMVALLVANGADVNAADKAMATPLHVIALGYDYWAVDYHDYDYEKKAQYLLDHGANIDPRDILGQTPLHWAAKRGHYVLANFLVANDANPNPIDNKGKTPLDLALTDVTKKELQSRGAKTGKELQNKDK